MIEVIGLSGKKRRGKDTVYGILEQGLRVSGTRVKREAFADRLKLSAMRCFKPDATIEEALAWTDDLKEGGYACTWSSSDSPYLPSLFISGREFLQNYGTEAHRDVFGSGFWVDQVLPPSSWELVGRYPDIDVLVITDVRFPNEAQRVKDHGGVIWEVVRPELDEQETDTHASEQPLPRELVDAVIVNDGTIDDLNDKVTKTYLNSIEGVEVTFGG